MEDSKKLSVIFMGTSSFAKNIFETLIDAGFNVLSAYTQPAKIVGRDQEMQKSVVEEIAAKNNIKVFSPEKFEEKTLDEIKKQNPDMIIVAAYGKILPEDLLKIPKFGALNVHPSLLPKFRGPSPVQNALLEGVTETGTTIMLIDKGMDTGDIISQKKVLVEPQETYPELLEKMARVSSELLLETIDLWVGKKINPQKQNDSEATYCQMIERSDGKIIWSDDAEVIFNRYRAFLPWPGVFTFWKKGKENLRLKIHKMSLEKSSFDSKYKIGQIIRLNEKILVKTGKESIVLEEIQLEGKPKTNIANFINGYSDFVGSILE